MKYFSQSFLYFSLGVSRDLVSCSRMSFSRIRHDDVIVRFSKGNWKEDRCEMQRWSYSEFRVPTQRQISAITYCFGSLIKFFSRKSRHSRHDIDRNAPCMLSFSLCLSLLFFFWFLFFFGLFEEFRAPSVYQRYYRSRSRSLVLRGRG